MIQETAHVLVTILRKNLRHMGIELQIFILKTEKWEENQ